MFDMKKFALFLAGKRREKNITQGQLADMVGVTHQAVSKWERGETMPELSKLSDLSNALDVPTEDFVAAMHSDEEEQKDTKYLDDEYYALPDKTLVGDVYVLAPFLSKQTLATAITEITLAKGSVISSLLFKFADEDTLRDVAMAVFSSESDKGRIHLLPHLPQNEISKLILNRYSTGGVNAIRPLISYSKDKDVVDMIFKSIVTNEGTWNPLKGVVSSIMPEVIVENGIDYAVKHSISSFNWWWNELGTINSAGIIIGYCRYFSHSFTAWSDVAPFLCHADSNLIIEELEKMHDDGYNFEPLTNLVYSKAMPAPIGKKISEYGGKAEANTQTKHYSFTSGFSDEMKEALKDEIQSELECMINELESRLDDLEDRLDDIEDRPDDLEDMIEDLENKFEALEDRLDDME